MSRLWFGIALCWAVVLVACGSATTRTSTSVASVPAATSGSGSSSAASTVASNGASTPEAGPFTSPPTGSAKTVDSDALGGGDVYALVPGKSSAQYEAHEKLAFLTSPSAAVGKTQDISGRLAFTGNGAVDRSKSKITVDLSTLTSDKSMRDNYIKQNTLQTDTYPDAVLVPTSIKGLSWPLPSSGQSTFTLVGDLTVHGVTKQTAWQVTASFDGARVTGVATTSVKFEDFGMTPPTTMIALSVQDELKLQIDFVVQKTS